MRWRSILAKKELGSLRPIGFTVPESRWHPTRKPNWPAKRRRGIPARGNRPTRAHGFGIELHEDPMLRPGDKTVLKEGMVFNVEPFGFDKDGIGYHLEDLMVVTESGNRLLTHGLAPTEIPVISKPLDEQFGKPLDQQ